MEKKFLIKFSDDWSDEFTMEGFEIYSEEDLKAFNYGIDNADYPKEAGFGTNEWFTFESKEEVREVLEITELSENEVELLEKLFKGCIGWIPNCEEWAWDES